MSYTFRLFFKLHLKYKIHYFIKRLRKFVNLNVRRDLYLELFSTSLCATYSDADILCRRANSIQLILKLFFLKKSIKEIYCIHPNIQHILYRRKYVCLKTSLFQLSLSKKECSATFASV